MRHWFHTKQTGSGYAIGPPVDLHFWKLIHSSPVSHTNPWQVCSKLDYTWEKHSKPKPNTD